MKILISGGTGLIGTELGKALVQKGHELIIITRNKPEAYLKCPFPHIAIDYNELNTHPDIPKVSSIINLAGANLSGKRWTSKYKKVLYDSRIKTTKQLIEVANKRIENLESFISTSAVGIYGNGNDNILSENSPTASHFLGQLCQDWEHETLHLKKGNVAIMRFGLVLSEKGGVLGEMVPPIQAGVGGPLASGQQYMSWIDIDDLVNMFLHIIDNKLSGVYNAVAPNPVTNKEMTNAIARHLNVKAFIPAPYLALKFVVGELADYLIESQRVSSKKIEETGFSFQFVDLKKSIAKRVPELKGTQRQVIFEQWVPKKRSEVFPFFADAKSLEDITPPHMKFKLIKSSTESMKKGTKLDYKLKTNGIPMKWQAEITEWNPPQHFCDRQNVGPFKMWHHCHQLEELASGTVLIDKLNYEIPIGFLGYIAASRKVRKQIEDTFNFRQEIIHCMFDV